MKVLARVLLSGGLEGVSCRAGHPGKEGTAAVASPILNLFLYASGAGVSQAQFYPRHPFMLLSTRGTTKGKRPVRQD